MGRPHPGGNPVVKKRQAELAKKQAAAQQTHNERLAEIRGYGINVKDYGLRKMTMGGKPAGRTTGYFSSISNKTLQDARNKALQTNQREQLRQQNQEIAQQTLTRRRRSSGRGSLVNALPRASTLGATSTIA